MLALSITAPIGGAEAGAQRCIRGQACSDIEPGSHIKGEAEIRSAIGARATFDLAGGVTLTMIGPSVLACHGGDAPSAGIERGLFALAASALEGARGTREVRLSLGDRALEIDPSMPARVAIRARDGGGEILVQRGRVTLRGKADALDLRAGEGATLSAGSAPRKQIGATIAADLDGAAFLSPAFAASVEDDRGSATRPRGLGTMTARAPGSPEILSGVRLSSHRVNVVIHDGFARTEVEEVFENETGRVLEGRYVFPVPPDAIVSRLGLWVGSELVEGEVVERDRAARIFKGIVEDTVRPRDPALLEWVSGSEVSLKVFPIPPHGSRKVVLAYDQVIDEAEGHARYLYPLSLGDDRAVTIDDFSMAIDASAAGARLVSPSTPGYAATLASEGETIGVSYHQKAFTPGADFAFTYDRAKDAASAAKAVTAYHAPEADGFAAMRLSVRWPEGAAPPDHVRRDQAIVIDTSHSQSSETLAGEIALAEGLLERLDPDERFVLLACDSACSTYPEDGLGAATDVALSSARRWLGQRTLGGSSDIAGALVDAAKRLSPSGAAQIVYLGDGAPTAGELGVESIARVVAPELDAQRIQLRLFGAGRTVDEVTLGGLARALSASYERVSTGAPLARRIDEIALGLRSPILTGARLEVPEGLYDVYPKELPSLRVGQALTVVARVRPGAHGVIKLRGTLGGAEITTESPIQWDSEASPPNAVVPRLWATARIADLEASEKPEAIKEVIALSRANYILSRRTALLVLENDRMFAEFGIERTKGKGKSPANVVPIPAPAPAARDTASFGRIGLLGMGDAPAAPIAPWGNASPDSVGSVGLGLSGVGEGGGGLGEGQGFGSGHGRLGGSHRATTSPKVRLGAPTVSGRLPPELVQRIVRQNLGRFRLCYENGLRRNPDLRGRVGVRFIVGHDGSVSASGNAGSDLPDAGVVDCVTRSFQGLTFPAPEGGIVTITASIVFAPGEEQPVSRWVAPPQSSFSEGPSVTHQKGDDRWMTQGEDALSKLRQTLSGSASIRQRHEALIRGLIAKGRFAEAKSASQRFAELDPDLPRARELLAAAAAANGDADLALSALDAEVELTPSSSELHARVARAFEAAGDERRACAHFRSARDLRPASEEAQVEALRCRSRLGERERVQAEIAAMKSPGKRLTQLAAALSQGPAPAYDGGKRGPGEMEAQITCEDGREGCPTVVVITPRGDVISPWTPGSARASEGTYRTLLIGGAPGARGEITVRAHNAIKKFPLPPSGQRTVAFTTVTPSLFGGLGFGIGTW